MPVTPVSVRCPVTPAAMIVGMLPLAIGGGQEEQNTALARAVIGSLLFATPQPCSWCLTYSRCCRSRGV